MNRRVDGSGHDLGRRRRSGPSSTPAGFVPVGMPAGRGPDRIPRSPPPWPRRALCGGDVAREKDAPAPAGPIPLDGGRIGRCRVV